MSNSFQYIYLEFRTNASPTSNEIWVKNISSKSDFELIKPITYAIEYEAHHQASSFYILETDNITKARKVIYLRQLYKLEFSDTLLGTDVKSIKQIESAKIPASTNQLVPLSTYPILKKREANIYALCTANTLPNQRSKIEALEIPKHNIKGIRVNKYFLALHLQNTHNESIQCIIMISSAHC
jgi:hypothetical protein